MLEFQKRPPFFTIAKVILTASLITSISNGNLLAAECEIAISGTNLLRAYSRALNNGAEFGCYVKKEPPAIGYAYSSNFMFIPFPTGLKCFHKKTSDQRGIIRPFKMEVFFNRSNSNWPLNGWKISRYKMEGGGQKKASRYGSIIFITDRPYYSKWSITLKKIWLRKKDGNCHNINNVITSAFGT